MSGTQTYAEMINQPLASDAEVQSASYPVLIPGVSGGAATTKLATIAQLTSAITTGVIVEEEFTYNAVPLSVPNLPSIPSTGGYCFLQGTIIAQNQQTRVISVWNIALAVYRTANATSCLTQGDTTPSIFTQDSSLAGCVVSLGAGSAGPSIVLTGLAATDISWGINLNLTTGD
jgi:hypothetical protein